MAQEARLLATLAKRRAALEREGGSTAAPQGQSIWKGGDTVYWMVHVRVSYMLVLLTSYSNTFIRLAKKLRWQCA